MEKYICEQTREDCNGCSHSKPHYNFYANANRCCTDEAWCAFHEVKSKCVRVSRGPSDKTK